MVLCRSQSILARKIKLKHGNKQNWEQKTHPSIYIYIYILNYEHYKPMKAYIYIYIYIYIYRKTNVPCCLHR
jgi:hypothetical protein